MHQRNRPTAMRRLAAALTLTGLLFSLAVPGAGAAPAEKRAITFRAGTDKIRLIVELDSAPLASQEADQPMAALSDALKAEQQQLRTELAKEKIEHRILSSYSKLFNGVAMEVRVADLARVANLPGVKSVHVDRPHRMPIEPKLSSSTEMIGVPQVRGGGPGHPGADGAGIKVAVIDTGIDYTHPDLGGCFGPGCRVVAGHDFVGDNFDGYNDPVPDADPMDVEGHGTHVAGIIGAQAASPDGVTGVAPAVQFVALKVFGTSFTWDSIIIQALEMAWDMRVDVVNMSLGDAFTWPSDPTAQASKWLSDRGVVVVAAAGNEGEYGEYATGSPANGPGSIAVASFENNMATRTGFLDPGGQPMGYQVMDFAPAFPTSGLSAEVVYCGLGTSDADFLNPDGTSKVAGKVALISRGAIPFREKTMRAQAHGAVQVLVYNNQPGSFGGTLGQPGDYLPTASLSREDGLHLRSLIEAGQTHLTYTGQVYKFVNETAGLMSSFSSWGPTPDLALKPDLTAPGGSIYSTYPMALGGYASLSGTSMASPHVAGAAALILQAKAAELGHMSPKARQEAVRALLMNNATPRSMGAGSDQLYPVHRQGAGMIDVFKAINAKQRITPDKLSLGELDPTCILDRRLTIVNTSSETQRYTFELIGEGVTLSASPSVLQLRPGQQSMVRLTINAEQAPNGLFYGWIRVRNGAGDAVAHVPYMGFKGDYQATTALDPLAYGLPWLAQLDDEGNLNPVNAMDLYPGCNCQQGEAYLVYSLARQAQELRVEVVNAQGRVVGEVFRAENYHRSAGEIEWAVFDGYDLHGHRLATGTYRLRLRALRPLGNRLNPSHWDVWTSGPITLH